MRPGLFRCRRRWRSRSFSRAAHHAMPAPASQTQRARPSPAMPNWLTGCTGRSRQRAAAAKRGHVGQQRLAPWPTARSSSHAVSAASLRRGKVSSGCFRLDDLVTQVRWTCTLTMTEPAPALRAVPGSAADTVSRVRLHRQWALSWAAPWSSSCGYVRDDCNRCDRLPGLAAQFRVNTASNAQETGALLIAAQVRRRLARSASCCRAAAAPGRRVTRRLVSAISALKGAHTPHSPSSDKPRATGRPILSSARSFSPYVLAAASPAKKQ